jgi:oxygen-independent coproporphyrinogen-3 oxidase
MNPANDTTPDIALYLHIPFCETKCPYCDFNTYEGISSLIPDYVNALCKELSHWGTTLENPVLSTIFIGGGTPSLLSESQLDTVMYHIYQNFSCSSLTEVTLECNPGDLTYEKALSLRNAGISRLSIGVQSLDDNILRILGRRHTSEEAIHAYESVRAAGFERINLDFMYGIPHQTLASWQHTIDQAILLAPDHLSLYCLTIEPNTPMEAMTKRGQLPEPDPDLAADMYEYCTAVLAENDYHHYEISNWAKPDQPSLHNLTYWKNGYYLGVGPGAHSHLSAETINLPLSFNHAALTETDRAHEQSSSYRFSVVQSPREYIRKATALSLNSLPPSEASWFLSGLLDNFEIINLNMQMAETMMLGLRLSEGISEPEFEKRFQQGLRETYPGIISELIDLRLIEWKKDALTLTEQGMLLGNEVFMRFVAE